MEKLAKWETDFVITDILTYADSLQTSGSTPVNFSRWFLATLF